MTSIRGLDLLKAVLVALIYGVSFVAIRIAVEEMPPLLVTGYRFFFAAFPLIFFVRRPSVGMGYVAAYGIIQGAIMFALIFTAIANGMPAGLTSLVAQMQVVFTILLAVALLGDRPRKTQVAGTVIGLGAIIAMMTNAGSVPLVPFLMVIAGAFAWAVANIIARKARPPLADMLGFIVWSSLAGAIAIFALSAVIEGTRFGLPDAMPSGKVILAIAFLAWVTQVLAFTWWVQLLNTYSSPVIMPFALLIPIFGFSSTALAFGETLTPWIAGCSAVVMAGLAITMIPSRKRLKA